MGDARGPLDFPEATAGGKRASEPAAEDGHPRGAAQADASPTLSGPKPDAPLAELLPDLRAALADVLEEYLRGPSGPGRPLLRCRRYSTVQRSTGIAAAEGVVLTRRRGIGILGWTSDVGRRERMRQSFRGLLSEVDADLAAAGRGARLVTCRPALADTWTAVEREAVVNDGTGFAFDAARGQREDGTWAVMLELAWGVA